MYTDASTTAVRKYERKALIAVMVGFLCGYTVYYMRYSTGRPEVFSDLVTLSETLDEQINRVRTEDTQHLMQFTIETVREAPLPRDGALETITAAQLAMFWKQFSVMFPQEESQLDDHFREEFHQSTSSALPSLQHLPLQDGLQQIYALQDDLIRSRFASDVQSS